MRDRIVIGAVLLAFATLLCVHATLAWGLARRRTGLHGLAALIVFPLAPLWGWRQQMRMRGAIWVIAAMAYLVALAMCFR